jgi:hypothetical protein
MPGVLLAGPDTGPATSVALTLTTLARDYVLHPALTTGPADGIALERVTARRLAELRSWAQIVVEYRRGDAVVAHDHERLHRVRDVGRVPVVVTDEPRVLEALLAESPGWLAVLICAGVPGRPWSRLRDRVAVVARTDLVPTDAVAHLVDRAVRTGAGTRG